MQSIGTLSDMELFNSLLESMSDPQRWHAITVHLPIVMGFLGLPLLVALWLLIAARAKTAAAVRWIAVAFYVVATISAVVAERSGHHAVDSSLADINITEEAADVLDEHREMAEKAWFFFAGTALLTAATALGNKRALPLSIATLALAASVATMGWICVTAHHGGELVYVHGVGVPESENNLPAAETQPAEPDATP